jgi:hypothetical protein
LTPEVVRGMVRAMMGCCIYFLGALSNRPFDIIREELSSWEPWKVVLSVTLVLVIASFVHKSNH